jgi:N utilization substance protein B
MSRRVARETALQVLYQIEMTGEPESFSKIIEHWSAEFALPPKSVEFAQVLVEGSLRYEKEIDAKIASTAHEWAMDRMNAVDRNLLRLAIFEMLYYGHTPHRVILNEAIEIAKKFGGDDSSRFINGILDKFMDAAER